jgi:hypothetical protein
MTERIMSFFDAVDVERVSDDEDPLGLMHSDLDLDWELQRLLGEEMNAMEPATAAAPAPARVATAERPTTRPATPISKESPVAGLPAYQVSPSARETEPLPAVSAWDEEQEMRAASMEANLSVEIDALYQQMTREAGSLNGFTQEVANLLKSAREALLAAPASVAEAESLVMQAHGLLKRREDSRRWGSSYGALILGYEFLFFLGFVAVLAFEQPLAAWAGSLTGVAGATALRDILPFWDTMIWGGVGGVLGALYSLHWHVTEKQDFDRQFNMWYVVQPIMGAMLGAFIYLIVMSGMLAMNMSTSISSTWFPSAVACLCGFRQKFVFELLDKLMEVIGLRPLLKKREADA